MERHIESTVSLETNPSRFRVAQFLFSAQTETLTQFFVARRFAKFDLRDQTGLSQCILLIILSSEVLYPFPTLFQATG